MVRTTLKYAPSGLATRTDNIQNFLDRNAIVNGKIDNMDKDLNLKGTEYNTCVSIFFVG